jgi:hypothetical protein
MTLLLSQRRALLSDDKPLLGREATGSDTRAFLSFYGTTLPRVERQLGEADVPIPRTMRRFHGRSPSGPRSRLPRHEGDWGVGNAASPSKRVRAPRTVSHRHEVRQRHRAPGGIATPGGLHAGLTRGARLVDGLGPEGRRVPSHRRQGAWAARGGAPKGSARAMGMHHRCLALGGRTNLSGRLACRHDGTKACGGHGVAAGRWTEGATRQPIPPPEPRRLRYEAAEEPQADDAPGQSAWPPPASQWAGTRRSRGINNSLTGKPPV